MAGRLRRRRRGVVLCAALVLVLAPALGGSAHAAQVQWDRKGAFEACLEARLDAWLKAQAELIVSNDPAANRTDDRIVTAWTADALAACKAGVGAETVAGSSERFTRHMAQWRQHIYDLATSIRQVDGVD